jgi:CRP-like cAMP-binding protein
MVSHVVESQLLDGFAVEQLRVILRAAKEKRFSANSVIVNQGDRAQELFLLTRGRARHFLITRDGHRVLLRWLVPGDVTGARAILPNADSYRVSTEALKDSRFLVWDRPTLLRLTSEYPRLLRNVTYIADDYLGWFITANAALSCFTARQRCAAVLKSIAITIGRKVAGHLEVEITNEELADASAITVFEASRFMSRWQRTGAIVKKRGVVLVRSLALLDKEIR